MKSEFQTNSNITVSNIDSSDWQAYRDFYKDLSDPILYTGFMQDADLDDQQTYSTLFNDMAVDDGPTQMLGLWRDGEIIGQFLYVVEDHKDGTKSAIVQGLEIADEFKGRGLFKKLTDAVSNHLRSELGENAKVFTSIRQDNRASLRIAKFYGMKVVEEGAEAEKYNKDGYHLLVYDGD